MRDSFLNRFTTTYSLRPIADVGSVFRRYPGMWQVGKGSEPGHGAGPAGSVAGLSAQLQLAPLCRLDELVLHQDGTPS